MPAGPDQRSLEQAVERAAELAARNQQMEPTARGTVLRRRIGPWEAT